MNGKTYLVNPGASHNARVWLEGIERRDGIRIYHAGNVGEYIVKIQRDGKEKCIVLDGYCESTNTVYMMRSDYWDGNPDVYPGGAFNVDTGSAFSELYAKMLNREHLLRLAGYKVVSCWEGGREG